MTVIEIVLVILIFWVIGMIWVDHVNDIGKPIDEEDWLTLIIGGLVAGWLIAGSLIIICLIIYGLLTAPWHDWFYNKLW